MPGPMPSTVSITPSQADLEMSSIALSGGEIGSYASGQVVVASAGASLSLALQFTLTDTRCASECIDQIEVGWVQGGSGPRSGCVFDNGVSEETGVSGSPTFSITAPTTPGEYDLRSDIGQNYSCGSGSGWWGNVVPGPATALAKLCVQ